MSEFLNLKDFGRAYEPNFALIANRLVQALARLVLTRPRGFSNLLAWQKRPLLNQLPLLPG